MSDATETEDLAEFTWLEDGRRLSFTLDEAL